MYKNFENHFTEKLTALSVQRTGNLLIQTKGDSFLKSTKDKPNLILLCHKFYFLGQDEVNSDMLILTLFRRGGRRAC